MSNRTNRNSNRAFAGILLVGVGAILLLHNMNFFFFPHWLFTWPMILIIWGIYIAVRHGFRNNGWIIFIGLGGFFLIHESFPEIGTEPFFWPVALMALGLLFILRPRRSCRADQADDGYKGGFTREGDTDTGSITDDGSEYIRISSVFSGVSRKILSKNFQGGTINCVFGGTEVDLTQADINGRVVIKIEQVFGGVKLMVPPNWTVLSEIDGVFHGMDDKRRSATMVNPDKVLVLRGSNVFAGIEIRSY